MAENDWRLKENLCFLSNDSKGRCWKYHATSTRSNDERQSERKTRADWIKREKTIANLEESKRKSVKQAEGWRSTDRVEKMLYEKMIDLIVMKIVVECAKKWSGVVCAMHTVHWAAVQQWCGDSGYQIRRRHRVTMRKCSRRRRRCGWCCDRGDTMCGKPKTAVNGKTGDDEKRANQRKRKREKVWKHVIGCRESELKSDWETETEKLINSQTIFVEARGVEKSWGAKRNAEDTIELFFGQWSESGNYADRILNRSAQLVRGQGRWCKRGQSEFCPVTRWKERGS